MVKMLNCIYSAVYVRDHVKDALYRPPVPHWYVSYVSAHEAIYWLREAAFKHQCGANRKTWFVGLEISDCPVKTSSEEQGLLCKHVTQVTT